MIRRLPPLGAAQRIVLFVAVGVALGIGAGVASSAVHAAEQPTAIEAPPVVAPSTPHARPTTTTAKSVPKSTAKHR
jgi:hypothetical protein